MPEYRFSYRRGRVNASFGITATNDVHAFKRMQLFTKQHSVKYINGSMKSFNDDDNRWHFLSETKKTARLHPATLQAAG